MFEEQPDFKAFYLGVLKVVRQDLLPFSFIIHVTYTNFVCIILIFKRLILCTIGEPSRQLIDRHIVLSDGHEMTSLAFDKNKNAVVYSSKNFPQIPCSSTCNFPKSDKQEILCKYVQYYANMDNSRPWPCVNKFTLLFYQIEP